MANKYSAFRDGGKHSEEAMFRLLNKIAGSTNVGVVGANDLLVTQNASPDMNVLVATGDIIIPYQSYFFHNWVTVSQTLAVTSNSSGNPRVDSLVGYFDLAVVQSTTSNNPDAFKLAVVAGSPSGTPSAPSGATIQAAVGASNPYTTLATIAVANGATSITNANITDARSSFVLAATASNILTFTNKKYSKMVAINEYDNGNSGASPAINWANGDRQKITLNANATFTFTNPTEGQVLTLWMVEDATGGRTITLPAGIKYPGGLAPSFTTTANAVNCIIIRYNGTAYYAQVATGFA